MMHNQTFQFVKSAGLLLAAVLWAGMGNSLVAQTASAPASKVDFTRHIKPILSDRCFLCHGPDAETREADLRLDIAEGAETVIESGEPESSELFLRISAHDGDQMPPPDSNLSLTIPEIELIQRWIREGASWEQHWSFVPPVKSPLPSNQQTDTTQNAIDAFILQALEQENLNLAPPASPEKILRRVTFDLTGLPPTLAELDTFLADRSPGAYERAVDRLLLSSRYGERMASDWLDLARYSDTYGYQVDRDRFVWPWRDWVVTAFNQNMPYDEFITEQLAGDLLPDPTDDQMLATTFNRLHPQKVEGGSVEEEFRVEYVADRSQTVGMAMMGLTVECARCHDHKYDPISQQEYYQLFAYFNNIDESGLYSFFDASAVPTPKMLLPDPPQKEQLATLRSNVLQLETSVREARTNVQTNTESDAPNDSSQFYEWLETKRGDVASHHEQTGVLLAADFTKTANGANQLVEGPGDSKALQLTGDDEVKLDTGDFQRHQPFSITAQVNVPDDPQLAKRAVILHRSRAWTDSASRGYQWLIEDGKLSCALIHFWPGDAICVQTQQSIPIDQWVQVTMTYDGSSRASGIRIFLDGQAVPVDIVRDHLEKTIRGSGTDHLVLGARFRDIGFKNGKLARLTVVDRELTDLEVLRLSQPTAFETILKKPFEELNPTETELLLEFYLATADSKYAQQLDSLAKARLELNQLVDSLKAIMVMREMPTSRQAYILQRGSYDAPGKPVEPSTPKIFPPIPDGLPNNRLGLAGWLTSKSNPLTARVAVNHYWQICFGNGLVRTPEDFGSQGKPPTHPELLDWLAVDFQEHGWDVQRLLKQIVMSQTYRQSTSATENLLQRDPENLLLARAPTYRLPAEMLRDNVLATSGLLVEKLGGPPVHPYELAVSFNPSTPDQGAGLYRRSLYTYWKRTGPAPVMLTLDAAKRDVCQVKRERTSSPLAALVQLNNPQTVEASRKLAEKLIGQHAEDSASLATDLFRTLTSRFPTEQERTIIESLFATQLDYFQNDEAAMRAFLDVGETKSQTEQPARLAAWAAVANTLYNFDECVMKR